MSGGENSLRHAQRIFALGLDYSREALFTDALPGRALHAAMLEALGLFWPVAAATVLATLVGPLLLGGLNFSAEALQPKFERLDPIKGLGKIFAMRGLVELGKALLKLLFIGGVLALLLNHWNPRAAGHRARHGDRRDRAMHDLAGACCAVVWCGAGADWCDRCGLSEIRSRQEPAHDQAGNPRRDEGDRRQPRDEGADPPGATGASAPTHDGGAAQGGCGRRQPHHFAVALRYDDGHMGAPRVIAKGIDVLAAQIRLVAGSHHIPLVEAPPLARALYATTRLGHEIPAALYVAVAQILAYVYQLKQATARGEMPPAAPSPEVDPDLMGPYRDR